MLDEVAYFRPNSPCSWAIIIIAEDADVNPDVTGMEIKSTKNPAERK